MRGLCGGWGISSWDPVALPDLIDGTMPRPAVLMIRSGLAVGTVTLDAAETLADRWKPDALWGMSPFGGDTGDPMWEAFDPRIFLRAPNTGTSRLQAAFRVAYHLPPVDAVAVGADEPAHLRELLDALPGRIDSATVHRYRSLLRERARGQPV